MPAVSPQSFRFGQFELDPASGELRRGGRRRRLQAQPFKLLVLLIRRAGAIVTYDEIRGELWGEDTFVEFDQAVHYAVRQIREALGDSADQPVYVETLPRQGYRFIAPVDAFEGSFAGARRYVLEKAGRAGERVCREVACAAAGHPECRFELRCDAVA